MNDDNHPWQQIPDRKPRNRPKNPGPREIEVSKLQEAFKRSGMTKSEIARRLGWMKTIADIHRFNEAIGLEANSRGHVRKCVTYKTAVRLAKAMNASFTEIGI